MRALLYITVRRFLNAFKRVPGSPRLLLPVLFFGLVFGLQLVAFFLMGGRGGQEPLPAFSPNELIEGGPGALRAAIRGLLLLGVFSSVVAAFGEGNLFFSQSDVDFLFPAPLSRRAVLLFRMLGAYAAFIIPLFYVPFAVGGGLAARAGVTPLAYWPGVLGAWLFLLMAANLSQTVLLNRPRDEDDATTREKIRKALAWVGFGLLLLGGFIFYLAVSGENGLGMRALLRAVNSHLVSVLFFPIAWASDLFLVAFDGWSMAAVGKLLALLALAGGSFALLFSRDRDFYEAAMNTSAKRTRIVTAVRSGDAGAILSQMAAEGQLARGRELRSFGGGARAILWKDLLSITRTPPRSWITLLVIAAFPALFGRAFGGQSGDGGIAFWVFLFLLNMSNIFLLSLRDMLRRADIMKALPVPPARLVLAELTLSIVQLTALGWLSLGLMVALGTGRGPLTLVAFLTLPTMAALLLMVQTSFVLLYPNRGDQAQNTIGGLLGLLASMLSLIPTIAVGLALYLAGMPPLLVGVGIGLTNLTAALAALAFATVLWQRFDPTD